MAKEIQDLEMKYICELTGKVRDLTVECGSSRERVLSYRARN